MSSVTYDYFASQVRTTHEHSISSLFIPSIIFLPSSLLYCSVYLEFITLQSNSSYYRFLFIMILIKMIGYININVEFELKIIVWYKDC